jgi:opacity protein-like surface antigen
MKKLSLITLLVLTFSFITLNAQNDYDTQENPESDSRFSFMTYAGIGYAVADGKWQPNYNLDANIGEFLVQYRIGKHYGISTGIGLIELTGNGFYYTHGPFYHERASLKFPLLFSVNYKVVPKVRLLANVGPYGQIIYRDEFIFFNGGNVNDIYSGWSFGLQFGVGMSYHISSKMSLGVMFNSQGDFNRLSIDTSKKIFADPQRISRINTLGLVFTINF